MSIPETHEFSQLFSIVPDSKSKVKSSSYLESGANAVVDQGKELIAGYTNGALTVDKEMLPVIVFGDHTRAVKYIDFPFTAGADGTQILKPSPSVNPKYGYYLVLNAVSRIPSKGYARHFGELKKIQFQCPSPEVQNVIVERLDRAFSEIDFIEENLEQFEEKKEQLLKSILNSSLKRFANKSELTNLLDDRGAARSDHFSTGSIDELCNVEYGTRVVRKIDAGTIYPVYGGGGETFFLDTFNRENRVVVARFAMSEKCTRRVAGKFALNDSGLTLSPKDATGISQEYLDYLVLSMNDQIYASARGTAQKNLDVPAFRRMEIFFPVSSERQQEIVENLDKALAEIDLLRSQFRMQKDFAIALRNSLLSAAFPEVKEVA